MEKEKLEAELRSLVSQLFALSFIPIWLTSPSTEEPVFAEVSGTAGPAWRSQPCQIEVSRSSSRRPRYAAPTGDVLNSEPRLGFTASSSVGVYGVRRVPFRRYFTDVSDSHDLHSVVPVTPCPAIRSSPLPPRSHCLAPSRASIHDAFYPVWNPRCQRR